MKMFNKNGAIANCHKDQKETMLKAGWSRTPFVVAEDIVEEDEEIMEDDSTIDTSQVDPVVSSFKDTPKKKKRKK